MEFTELKAFANRHTLTPDVTRTIARAASYQLAAAGVLVDEEKMMPIAQPDPDELRRQAEAAAEKAMDRRAET